jgi:transposase
MYAATLLADPTCLRLERIVSAAESLTLVVRTTAAAAACPTCGVTSGRVHSRYVRVGLEHRRPIELPPDCESATLAAWLRAHPGVRVISRDRGGAYAERAREGASAAVQVADRWHLLKNLSEALERLLTRKHHLMAQAAQGVTVEMPPQVTPPVQGLSLPAAAPTRAERERAERRERRRARYTEATEMRQRGAKVATTRSGCGASCGRGASGARRRSCDTTSRAGARCYWRTCGTRAAPPSRSRSRRPHRAARRGCC